MLDDLAGKRTGERIQILRERRGLSRPVLAGLVGMSASWLKGIERGTRLPPRLPLLVKLAEALAVGDVAVLAGTGMDLGDATSIPVSSFARIPHDAVPAIREAIRDPLLTVPAGPVDVAALAARAVDAWLLWHQSPQHRTDVGRILPRLVTDARVAARVAEGQDRRVASAVLADVYALVQHEVVWASEAELTWTAADRAMTAAQDADTPAALAGAAWTLGMVQRSAGDTDTALTLVQDAAGLLEPRLEDSSDETRGLYGALQLHAATTAARAGREGDAWRHWDAASATAERLPGGYYHSWTMFGAANIKLHAVSISADLSRSAYEAVSAALGEAAGRGPVLAVVDDLHAADDASLGLLQLLAGDLHRMPVLCVFTVRDTEPSRPLAQALGELLRHPGTERLAVEAFSPADVAALLDRLTAQPPSAEVVAALMSRTGGNPFYTTELVRLVRSEQRRRPLTAADVLALDVPSGILDVLMHRVRRLPDDTQSLLTLAAVAGRELVPELLAHLAGLDAEHLLFNLEPAVAAGLVTPAEAGWGYRFRHPLIHESLYASTGPAGRARLHGRVAAALEDLSAARTAVDVAQLAHHYLAAGPFGDPAKAVGYAREAAARAVRQGAWPDAVRHLRDALSVITPGSPGADATRCDVLTELGQACRSGGMIAEANRALADAGSLAHRIGDEDRELAAAVAFGTPALWGSREWGEPDTGLVPLLERQLSRVADTDPSRRIRILSTLATELAHDQGHDRGWGYAAEALEAARGLGRPEELSLAVNAYLVFAHMTDRVAEGRRLMDEMLAARDQVSVPVQALIQANLLTERIRCAELARFDAEFPAAWRLAADELRSPELRGQLRFIQSSRYLVSGDVSQATEAAERGFGDLATVTTAWDQPSRFVYESCLMLITGTLSDHAEELAARIVRPEHPSVPHLAAPAAALGLAWRGDLQRARDIAGRWFTPPARTWTRMQAIAYWAQVAIELGVPDPGWLYDQLRPGAGQLAIVGTGLDCGGAVDSLLAGLAWRLGRLDAAAGHARAGLELDHRVGSPVWVARSGKLLAQVTA